jgi:hypothetical protein
MQSIGVFLHQVDKCIHYVFDTRIVFSSVNRVLLLVAVRVTMEICTICT